jgi:hypothetical protein
MRAQHPSLRAAVAFLVAAGACLSVNAAESPLRHTFQVTYRGFGSVSVESDFISGSAYDLRPEGCYARASSEAVCGFTLRAHGPITLTNFQNASHALRADGSTTRTCCVFVAGDPNGYPLTAPGAPTEGVRPLERHLKAGETLEVILRIPDYGAGAPIAGVVFSRGEGDAGVKAALSVRDLAAPRAEGVGR